MTKTVVAQTYGTPEVLKLVDVDLPAPKSGEVLVDVKAIGVNPFDFKLYSGAFGTDPEKLPIRLGGEAAGVVSAVGDGVTNVNVGDEVIVSPGNGLYSEQVVVPVSSVTAKPAGISWEQAAGLLLVGGTAVDALDTIRVGSGDTVLIHGASGGVGAIAVQLAVGRGATVIGTAGASNQDYVRSLGATPVLYGHGSKRVSVNSRRTASTPPSTPPERTKPSMHLWLWSPTRVASSPSSRSDAPRPTASLPSAEAIRQVRKRV